MNMRRDIAITGIAGRFPSADDIEQFKNNLFDKIDMVTADNTRWPKGLWGLPERNGKIASMNKFDAKFFGYTDEHEVNAMDPQDRLLLETTVEALLDAGINPRSLRGTKTACYHGNCFAGQNAKHLEPEFVNAHVCTLRTRVSQYLGITGPVFHSDTACASGLTAFNEAYHAIRTGLVDQAIVLAANNLLKPRMSVNFMRMRMNSRDGKCKCLDTSADGYVRSEALVVMILQRTRDAKRIHAKVLNSSSNSDGYKEEGVTFPSVRGQVSLIDSNYREIGLDPKDVTYVEAHVTGTQAGDVVESNALHEFFFKNNVRDEPLLMGCLKSSIGHSEGASGLCSLAKAIIIHQTQRIPANIHYKTPNPKIRGLANAELEPVTQTRHFENSIVPVNCFGFGGSNVHVVTQRFDRVAVDNNNSSQGDPFPRLVLVCGRTPSAVEYLIDSIVSDDRYKSRDFLSLVDNMSEIGVEEGMECRAFMILEGQTNGTIKHSVAHKEAARRVASTKTAITFDLIDHDASAKALQSLRPLKHFKSAVDSLNCDLLLGKTVGKANVDVEQAARTMLVHIGLVEVLKALQVAPDNNITGHYVGWLAVALFQNAITRSQAMESARLVALHRHDKVTLQNELRKVIGETINWSAGRKISVSDLVKLILAPRADIKTEATINLCPHKSRDFVLDVLKNIGRIYVSGRLVRVANLYPKVCYPLPSSTPFLSPLIKWYHGKSWPLTDFVGDESNNFYWRTVKNIEYTFDFSNAADEFLYDHRISSRLLFPGIGYILFAWITLAELHKMPIMQFPVRFEKIAFKRALVLSKSTRSRFTVRIDEATGAFEVIDGTNSIVSGFVFPGESNSINEDIEPFSPSDNDLDAKAIATELKVRGYEYGPYFRSLKRCTRDGSHGQIIFRDVIPKSVKENMKFKDTEESDIFWLNSWIPFIDNVLQLQLLDLKNDHRCLCIPTAINYLACDPKELRKALDGADKVLDDLTGSECVLIDAVKDSATETVCCPGFIARGLKGSIVNNTKQSASLFKYKFSPFRQSNAVNRTKGELIEKYFEKVVRASSGSASKDSEPLALEPGQTALLDCVRAKRMAYEMDLSQDLLIGNEGVWHFDDELIKPHLELIISNFVPIKKKIKILEVNAANWPLADLISEHLAQNFLVDLFSIDYTLFGVMANRTKSSTVKQYEWNGKVLTQHLAPADFVVFRAGSDTTSEVAHQVCSAVNSGGFLMIVTRGDIDEKLAQALEIVSAPEPTATKFDCNIAFEFGLSEISNMRLHHHIPLRIQLFRKPPAPYSREIIIDVNVNSYDWLEPLKVAMDSPVERIWLRSEGLSGLLGLTKSLRLEENGHKLRCCADYSSQKQQIPEQVRHLDLALNVRIDDRGWGVFSHIELPEDITDDKSELVLSDNYYLKAMKPGNLSSLAWVENNVRESDRLVDVHYSALNFRDIMFAAGKLSYDAVPYVDPRVLKDSFLGFEYSGLNRKTGKRVMGIIPYKGLASQLLAEDDDFLWEVPASWSLEDAATVPGVYTTVYYAMIIRGKLIRSETVLIHSGAGGVGLAAIRLALSLGCSVFTSVGSEEKKNYLLSEFPELDGDHIFNSHANDFEEEIARITNGRGVDVVLNSLADEKLQASIRCLAEGGRFLEIGKVDFVQNSPLDINQLQSNQTFHGILLDALCGRTSDYNTRVKKEIHELLREGIANGVVRPLRRTLFAKDRIEDAFRFMSSGKHLGKVVIRMKGDRSASRDSLMVARAARFDPDKSYIIIGGLGGFGLELVQWMAEKGARKFVISSRSAIKRAYQGYVVDRLARHGNSILVRQLDASRDSDARDLLAAGHSLGPVGGVFCLSAVLRDGLFRNQTTESFRAVCDAKARPAMVLDALSREMCPFLDYFVAFSSLSCGRGNEGQSNYNLANSLLESVCQRRRANGLHGLAIQWGFVGDVGLVEESMGSDFSSKGFCAQKMHSCLDALDRLLLSAEAVVTSCTRSNRERATKEANGDIIKLISGLIGVKDMASLDGAMTLGRLGIDSLINVEIKQVIEKATGVALDLKQIRDLNIANLMQLNNATAQ